MSSIAVDSSTSNYKCNGIPLWVDTVAPELRNRRVWCLQKEYPDGSRKLMRRRSDGKLSPLLRNEQRDPSNYHTLDELLPFIDPENGIYVALVTGINPELCVIDIDVDEDTPEGRAFIAEVVHLLATYGCWSRSGRGVHIYFFGKHDLPKDVIKVKVPGIKQIEFTPLRSGAVKAFTFTGNKHPKSRSYVAPDRRTSMLTRLLKQHGADLRPERDDLLSPPTEVSTTSDEDVLAKVKKLGGAAVTAAIENGDYGGKNPSDRDFHVACTLARVTRDPEQIERIMRASPLAREKWDKQSEYLPDTIANALRDTQGTYLSRRTYLRTDIGNAERFVDRYGWRIRYCATLDQWFIWDGVIWRVDRTNHIRSLAMECAKSMLPEALLIEDSDDRNPAVKWALKSMDGWKITAMLKLAMADRGIAIHSTDLDSDLFLLATPTGVIDLQTGELLPHDSSRLITKVSPAEYYTDAPEPPTFMRFLTWMFPDAEVRSFVLRLLGMCLTGDIREQYAFIFWGSGANGKSTLLELVQKILGDYATLAAPGMFEDNGNRHPCELDDLRGRRFVMASEWPENSRVRASLLKSLTGDASIKARGMHRDWDEFPRTHKTIFVTNNKPRINEDSEGMWRRVVLIPCTSTVSAGERDPELPVKLAEEMPEILSLLVRHCLDWQKNGLRIPDAVRAATDEYRQEENPLNEFVSDCCDFEVNAPAPIGDVYQQYVNWTSRVGRHAMNRTTFTRNFIATFAAKVTSKQVKVKGVNTRCFVGLKLRTDASAPPEKF